MGMVYDAARRVVWLHGGRDLDVFHDDVWHYDGTRWARQATGGPGARAFQAAVFVPRRRAIVIFGGIDPNPLGDAWTWRRERWRRLDGPVPSARSVYAAAFDAARGYALIHGGGHRTRSGWTIVDETWGWANGDWRLLAGRAPAIVVR
jgi:hypothetical protein